MPSKARKVMRKVKFKTMRAWAEIGSHGHIFFFAAGPVHQAYGPLMHIFLHKREGLVPVKILIPQAKLTGEVPR